MNESIPTQPLALLRHYLRPFRGRVLLLTLLLLAGTGLQLAAPGLLGRFVDAATSTAAMSASIALLAILFFLTVLAQKVIRLVTVYYTEDLGWATTNRLRADLVAHVLRLDMGFHKMRTPGELIDRIDGDVAELVEYFSELVVNLIGNSVFVLGLLAIIFWMDWRAGLIALAYALAMLTILRVVQNSMVNRYGRLSQARAELLGFLEERITGTEDIVPNGGSGYVMQRLYPLLNRRAFLSTQTYTLSTALGAAGTFLFALTLAAILGVAAMAYLSGAMTIGTVFALATYVGLLQSPLDSVRRELAGVQRALAGIGRTRELFELQPGAGNPPPAARQQLPATPPEVRFRDVAFAYNDRLLPAVADTTGQLVLDGVSFTLAPGKVLGVLGRTGSGKTTLTRLLFRLYDVDRGSIALNAADIRQFDLAMLRQRVGIVTQDVQLFAASVRDNLTLFGEQGGKDVVDDAAIVAALEILGLGDWFRSLPAGLDTVLESGGRGLSAGEAQLLALTRVFLRDPQLIVLDEASSRLDPATEHLLEQAIDRLLAGRTAIIIAHRLRTVQRADDILILQDGRVIEHGPRLALAADPYSRFARLLQTGLEEVLA